ncbi:MAG: class I SAM-dependent methyltransferase [Desulfatiglans sp.]|jgi:SAM-dependent methyltransferase|nr:class I SAM-dependent methyltransferase [Desulfatiglans sp.]
MPKISPFEKHAEQYERWFVKNSLVYKAELRAVKAMLPSKGDGVEIEVGTGRFAEPLGIKIGVEPSKRMREIAQKRGIHVLDGVAERLPFNDYAFDFVLMVTTICFVDDIERSLLEAYRILSSGGILVIGFVDRDSMVGKMYAGRQNENLFYKEATFFSVDGLVGHMNRAGFVDLTLNQTIFGMLSEITNDEPVKPGHGEGSFVVIRGRKEESKGDGNPEEEQGAHEKMSCSTRKKPFLRKIPKKWAC